MKKILFSFQQIGGVNALLPLIEKWRSCYDIIITGRDMVTADLQKRGIAVSTYKELGIDPAAISTNSEWFEKITPDIVITDTIDLKRTPDGIACREFWSLAARYGIPAIAYMDCWWGYNIRFRLAEESTPLILPGFIAVVDRLAERDIIAAGFPAEKIIVLGSPKFEYLSSLRTENNRDSVRDELGLSRDKFIILFVSQPLEKTFGSSDYYGFTEKTTLSATLSVLGKYPTSVTANLSLIVLLHPEENEDSIREVIEHEAKWLEIEILKLHDPYRLLASADLVIGMSSILLAEAVIMKLPVLSVQLDMKLEEILITNAIGATLSINNYYQLKDVLYKTIMYNDFRANIISQQATFKIIIDTYERWNRFVNTLINRSLNSNGRGIPIINAEK